MCRPVTLDLDSYASFVCIDIVEGHVQQAGNRGQVKACDQI